MIRIFVLLALVVSISAHAQTTITTAGQPASLWAVAPSEKGSIDTAALKRLRAEGINALVVDAQSSRVGRVLALHTLVRQMKMWLVVVVPRRSQTPAARRALSLCRGHASNIRCAGLAPSLGRARTMAHNADSVRPFVALYASSPTAVSQLETLGSARRHVVVIAPLYKSFNSSVWGRAIGTAATSPAVDLAVAPVTSLSSKSMQSFGTTLASGKTIAGTPPDVTPPSTPSVTLETVTASSATVSWLPSVDDVGVSGYRVYVGGSLVQSTSATRTTLSGLTCGAAATIAVDAVDASGNASARSALTATPGPCGGGGGGSVSPPTSPTGLSVSGVTATAAKLSWTASSDDRGVSGYRLYLGAAQVATVSGTNFTFTGLTCAKSYTLGVAAYDTDGNVSGVSTASVSTSSCPADTAAPSTPTGLATSGVGQTSVGLSWNGSTDNVGVTGYRIFQNGSQIGTSFSPSYLLGGLTCGTAYTVGVAAVDAAGNVSTTATTNVTTTACPDTTAPSTPTGLVTSAVGATSAILSWAPSTDNVSVTGYRLYRGLSQVGTASGTTFTYSGLSCGTSYALGVAAVDGAGNVSGSATTNVTTTPCPDTSAPSTPTGLAASAVDLSSATLSWTASSDNVAVTGYRIFRAGTQVGTTASTSFTVTGMLCGTSYTLGVAAVDAAGNVSATATTNVMTTACPDTSAPSTPTGLATSAVGQTSATLSWSASSDNVGVVGYRLFRGGSQVGTASGTTFTYSGLTCGTSYVLGVAAIDAAGNASVTATTGVTSAACPDTVAPSTPTGVGTSAVGQSSATLSWTASSDNVAVTGYRVFRDGTQVGTSSSTSFTVTGLNCATSYTLGVAALDAAGNVSATATKAVTTTACPDTTAPSVPTGLTTSAVGQTSTTLAWTASSDNVAVTGYRLFRDGTQVGTAASTTFDYTALSCSTSYVLGVAAVDAAGNVSATATKALTTAVCSDTSAPSTPTGLAAGSVGQTSAGLSWNASTDDVGVTGYRIYQNGSQIGTSLALSYLLGGLTCATTYTVGVAAVDGSGNVSGIATLSVTTAACPDTVAPSTPTGLGTSAVTQTSATLSWAASSDNVAVTGYRLFRGGSQVGTATATSYGYTGLTCGTAYVLGVAAVDAAGNVSATATTNLTTAACPDTSAPSTPTGLAASAVAQTSATLSWTASSDNVAVTGYRVFRAGTQVGTTSSTTFTVTGLTCATTYTLGVAALDAAGNVSATATTSATTPACPDTSAPSTPTGLATSAVTQTGATLSWSASTDNVGVTGYRVFRSGTQVGTPTTTSFAFSGLTCGTSYTIGVAAVDAAGNVSATATTSVTTVACPDTSAPSTPTGLSSSGTGQTSVALSWIASTDNVGVSGYRLYQNGTQVGTSSSVGYIFGGLTCATSYTLGVAAVDGAGNVSGVASLSVTTLACADSVAPSTPAGLATSGVGQTGVSLSWSASSDNVGVTGYRAYLNGAQVGTSSTGYAFSGLACATSYTLGVAAVDAAGNVSGVATASVTTAACSGGGGGAANVAVSTSGNDSTCVRGDLSKPCLSLSKAYSLAQGGDRISVGCGSYGGQSIPARSLGTSLVTIQKDPADGRCTYVSLTGSLQIHASYLVVDGFSVLNNNSIGMPPPGLTTCTLSYVTIKNFQASGVDGGCDHITLLHGDVGTGQNACNGGPEDGVQFRGPSSTGQWNDLIPPTNMVIDDVTIHDTTGFVGCGSHTDGLQSFGCNNCTVRNSRFMNNDTSDIILYQITGAASDIQNILVENNSFGSIKNPGHGVSIGGQACSADIPSNVIVQNNTFTTANTADINCVGGKKAGTFRNNLLAANDSGFACRNNLAYDYNVFASGGCGTHPKVCSASFLDPGHSNGNVDLSMSDTCAKDMIPTGTAAPTTDIHGAARPLGTGIDAGADEAGP